jgi:hypothetical protein
MIALIFMMTPIILSSNYSLSLCLNDLKHIDSGKQHAALEGLIVNTLTQPLMETL